MNYGCLVPHVSRCGEPGFPWSSWQGSHLPSATPLPCLCSSYTSAGTPLVLTPLLSQLFWSHKILHAWSSAIAAVRPYLVRPGVPYGPQNAFVFNRQPQDRPPYPQVWASEDKKHKQAVAVRLRSTPMKAHARFLFSHIHTQKKRHLQEKSNLNKPGCFFNQQ